MKHRVLIVEDDLAMAQLLVEGLSRRGFEAAAENSGDAALAALRKRAFDAVVTDLNMKGLDGITLCERIVAAHPGLPVLVITAFGSMETAIKAIRAGAYDFLTKPLELDALQLAVERAMQHRQLREEVKRLREEAGARRSAAALLGESPCMQEVKNLIARVADSESTVLVTGESGTGKELVARALHDASRRKAGPFLSVSCSALSEAMLEIELFGQLAGPGREARAGLFQRAKGGTVFLDEVGELPLTLQPRLLRALQERRARPVGSDVEQPFDARIITASHRDLETAVEERRFREDLYFRINVINLHVPPLRMRGNDVLLLAQHFVRQAAEKSRKQVTGLSSSAAEKLLSYGWPGNVRELQTVIERAVALTRYAQLTVEDLPEKVLHPPEPHRAALSDESVMLPMADIERMHILRVLRAVGGHRTQAAKILGLDRKTLYRKLEMYGPAEVEAALKEVPGRPHDS
jgi:DNA-binding NtrC family response regulator